MKKQKISPSGYAREKAFKVAPHYANSLIIGSDQTAECQNQIIEKPNTP